MVFALVLAGLIAVMLLAPDTPAARWLHGVLVDEGLRLAERVERRHLIFLVIGLVSIQALAMTLPADLAVLAAWDITAYVDVMIATWTLAAFARVRSVKVWAMVRVTGLRSALRRGGRARRARRSPAMRRAANDDDPAPWWAAAAA